MKKCLKISSFAKPCIIILLMTIAWAPAFADRLHSHSFSYSAPISSVDEVTIVTHDSVFTSINNIPQFNAYNYLATNSIDWAFGIANIAWELDLAKHWSVNLPVALSAWDYFSSNVKFRVASFRPELRYWLTPARRFFLGAHVGVAYFNMAFGGDYRYQDHKGKDPAIGGGISFGYRLPITQSRRWWLELTAGVGVYYANYDKFINKPNGALLHSHTRTAIIPDCLGVKFIYRFNTFSVH
jgi:hypothetical protein